GIAVRVRGGFPKVDLSRDRAVVAAAHSVADLQRASNIGATAVVGGARNNLQAASSPAPEANLDLLALVRVGDRPRKHARIARAIDAQIRSPSADTIVRDRPVR